MTADPLDGLSKQLESFKVKSTTTATDMGSIRQSTSSAKKNKRSKLWTEEEEETLCFIKPKEELKESRKDMISKAL